MQTAFLKFSNLLIDFLPSAPQRFVNKLDVQFLEGGA